MECISHFFCIYSLLGSWIIANVCLLWITLHQTFVYFYMYVCTEPHRIQLIKSYEESPVFHSNCAVLLNHHRQRKVIFPSDPYHHFLHNIAFLYLWLDIKSTGLCYPLPISLITSWRHPQTDWLFVLFFFFLSRV